MANNSNYEQSTNDLPTQPIKISGDTQPIRLKSTAAGKPKAERGESRPGRLGGLILGTSVLIAFVAVALVVYNRGGFSMLAVGLAAPAGVSAAAPVGVTPSSTQVDAAKIMPQATIMPPVVVAKAPATVMVFDQAQLDSFNIQLADLVVLDPQTTWGRVSDYRNLADWATAGTAQALSEAGDQHFSGAGFRSQNTLKGTALVTSTVHEFTNLAAAQKGVQIMAADVKTRLTNDLDMQASLTLHGGATAPVVLVSGSQGTATYVFFIARYNNLVVDVAASGFDSSSTGLNALVKDCKTLGQQMVKQIAGAAPLQ